MEWKKQEFDAQKVKTNAEIKKMDFVTKLMEIRKQEIDAQNNQMWGNIGSFLADDGGDLLSLLGSFGGGGSSVPNGSGWMGMGEDQYGSMF